jgi:hypothetical protein
VYNYQIINPLVIDEATIRPLFSRQLLITFGP